LLKKPLKEAYSFFPSSLKLILAFTLGFSKLDACASKKVYRKKEKISVNEAPYYLRNESLCILRIAINYQPEIQHLLPGDTPSHDIRGLE
jgi:hypothetical protein